MIYDIERSGECIRQLRIRNGYTQEQLAKELHIDQSFLSRIESGRKGCSVDLFVQFSEFFHVSLDVLILGKETAADLDGQERAQLKATITALIDQLAHLQRQL